MLNTQLSNFFYDTESIPVAVGKETSDGREISLTFYTDDTDAAMESLLVFLQEHRFEHRYTENEVVVSVNIGSVIYFVDFNHIEKISEIPLDEVLTDKTISLYDKKRMTVKGFDKGDIIFATPEELLKRTMRWRKRKKKSFQMPVPEHLKDIMIPYKGGSQHKVTGMLRCSCGKKSFVMKFDNESDGYLLEAECCNCGGAYVVFDSRIHGWDGFVCGTARDGENKKNVLKEYECKECGKTEFSADIKILSQGPDDFAEELKDEICQGKFSKKDWINAFEWITVSLMCDNCGCRCEDFVDYETM